MTPEERYEALSLVEGSALEVLADAVLATGVPVRMLTGPEVVTAPVRLEVPGTVSTSAVVGHVAVTQCGVELGLARGDGCRPGNDLRGAVAAAVCDAEVERDGPHSEEVVDLAARSLLARAEVWAERARQVELTRVEPGA